MIDVIITEFFPMCFKMAERFENLDNNLFYPLLCDYTTEKIQHEKQKEAK